mgnify:CR=1 FL=1
MLGAHTVHAAGCPLLCVCPSHESPWALASGVVWHPLPASVALTHHTSSGASQWFHVKRPGIGNLFHSKPKVVEKSANGVNTVG